MKQSTKSRVRMALRMGSDMLKRTRFARSSVYGKPMDYSISVSQPFKPSSTLESKKHNLREAASRINKVTVMPGEVFSFWRVVGNPNNAKRFREGRSIHGSEVTTDLGGGLCQASGIIHHLALMGGLKVLERHNHSIDLYTDETRFAPLGTDATVFYGYKDLRLENDGNAPIRFDLEINDDCITASLLSEKPIDACELKIDVTESTEGVKDVRISRPDGTAVSASRYLPLIEE